MSLTNEYGLYLFKLKNREIIRNGIAHLIIKKNIMLVT